MSFFHAARTSLAAERELYPHVCAVCALPRREPGVCAHHTEALAMTQESGEGYGENWAEGNRAFCNWLHRLRTAA